jgi:hypothetical protein
VKTLLLIGAAALVGACLRELSRPRLVPRSSLVRRWIATPLNAERNGVRVLFDREARIFRIKRGLVGGHL